MKKTIVSLLIILSVLWVSGCKKLNPAAPLPEPTATATLIPIPFSGQIVFDPAPVYQGGIIYGEVGTYIIDGISNTFVTYQNIETIIPFTNASAVSATFCSQKTNAVIVQGYASSITIKDSVGDWLVYSEEQTGVCAHVNYPY
jgi:hypothetical protein